jgi:hypothetical protein
MTSGIIRNEEDKKKKWVGCKDHPYISLTNIKYELCNKCRIYTHYIDAWDHIITSSED